MQQRYLINQPNLFTKNFVISDGQNIIATVKFKGLADTKAVAEFSNQEWLLKSSFLNNEVSLKSTSEVDNYNFEGSVISSKGSLKINNQEYIFRALFLTKSRSFVWKDNAGQEAVKFTDIGGLLKLKFEIYVSESELIGKNLNILLVMGFYLIKTNYYSMGSGPH